MKIYRLSRGNFALYKTPRHTEDSRYLGRSEGENLIIIPTNTQIVYESTSVSEYSWRQFYFPELSTVYWSYLTVTDPSEKRWANLIKSDKLFEFLDEVGR